LGGNLRLLILSDMTELRQSQTQRDRALQFLSHDMRTPLASILSLTHKSNSEGMSKGARPNLQREKIIHHANALLEMMDDFILTVSAEAPQYKVQQVLLDNLINDAIEQVADLAEAKSVQLKDTSLESTLFVMANTRLLLRALINLLYNAIKFSPIGSTLTIEVQAQSHSNAPESHAVIKLTNPVEIHAGSADLIPSMPGFGLGLDFVDTVIQKHHGHISREIPAQGTATVRISLPCSRG
jgi:signal transduction histidine kinase